MRNICRRNHPWRFLPFITSREGDGFVIILLIYLLSYTLNPHNLLSTLAMIQSTKLILLSFVLAFANAVLFKLTH